MTFSVWSLSQKARVTNNPVSAQKSLNFEMSFDLRKFFYGKSPKIRNFFYEKSPKIRKSFHFFMLEPSTDTLAIICVICTICVPFLSPTELTELTEIIVWCHPFSVFSVVSVCPIPLRIALLLDPPAPKGRRTTDGGITPRYQMPNTRKPWKGERSFVPSALLLLAPI